MDEKRWLRHENGLNYFFLLTAKNTSNQIASQSFRLNLPTKWLTKHLQILLQYKRDWGLQGYFILFPLCLECADDKFANVMLKLDRVCLQT